MELQAALSLAGVAIPPSGRDRLSPAADSAEVYDGQLDLHQRPSPGLRSHSDSGPSSFPFASRERQRLGQSGGMLSSSNSMSSFATANNETQSLSSSSDKDRSRRKLRNKMTPIMQMSSSSSTMSLSTASPNSTGHDANSRSRDGQMGVSMPPLSSSASTSGLLAHSEANARDKEGLITIPSTPVLHDDSDGVPSYTSSPVQTSFAVLPNRSGSSVNLNSDRSDAGSSDHYLRMPRTSPMPSSPSVSASSISVSQFTSGSPRSPCHPSSGLENPSSQQLPNNPSVASRPVPAVAVFPYIPAVAIPSTSTSSQRPLRRKASSLDLTSTSEKSPLPSRASTPPPALGSPMLHEPTPTSPAQHTTLPRTPPPQAFPGDTGQGTITQFSTPVVELPDEARRYIMAQHGGVQLPSPGSPYHFRKSEKDRRNVSDKVSLYIHLPRIIVGSG